VVRLEEKLNKGKLQECAFFTNKDIKHVGELVKLHCVKQYFITYIVGPCDKGLPDVGEVMRRPPDEAQYEEVFQAIRKREEHGFVDDEDIQNIMFGTDVLVDDDNEPAPENIPTDSIEPAEAMG
jgi:hypothetical protein